MRKRRETWRHPIIQRYNTHTHSTCTCMHTYKYNLTLNTIIQCITQYSALHILIHCTCMYYCLVYLCVCLFSVSFSLSLLSPLLSLPTPFLPVLSLKVGSLEETLKELDTANKVIDLLLLLAPCAMM